MESGQSGHPVYWTPEKKQQAIEIIINRIVEGESVRSILTKADRTILPSHVTFCEWLKDDNGLAKQYAYACEMRADAIFDEIIEIADDKTNDSIQTEWGEKPNKEWINRSRLRVDARKWTASKLNPKKYGDKLDLTSQGQSINPEEREKRIQELILKAKSGE